VFTAALIFALLAITLSGREFLQLFGVRREFQWLAVSIIGPGQDRQWVTYMAKPRRGRSTGAIDDYVGGRIRERRIMLGLTQQQLAEMIGVTYQQAHKYERGINRVSAGRLYEIARVLNAPITYFYEGLGEETPRPVAPHQRMLLEIARNFAEIQNEKHQEAVSQLARVLAGR
jgi:transcriptional regulator with XRE-family HTH domain